MGEYPVPGVGANASDGLTLGSVDDRIFQTRQDTSIEVTGWMYTKIIQLRPA